jgi:hypothetical protein
MRYNEGARGWVLYPSIYDTDLLHRCRWAGFRCEEGRCRYYSSLHAVPKRVFFGMRLVSHLFL